MAPLIVGSNARKRMCSCAALSDGTVQRRRRAKGSRVAGVKLLLLYTACNVAYTHSELGKAAFLTASSCKTLASMKTNALQPF